VSELTEALRDILYNSRRTMREIFQEAQDEEGNLDLEGFTFLCKKFAPSFRDSEVQALFRAAVHKKGRVMTLAGFEKHFKWAVPKGNFEVEGLNRIRSWMSIAGLSADQAFETLAKEHEYISKAQF
jgi:hypothetical protein